MPVMYVNRLIATLLLTALVIALPVLARHAQAQVVPVGAGSYLIEGQGKTSPVRGPNFTGPAPTQQWFTDLVFAGKNATNEYPHPLAVRPTGNGLVIFFPGPNVSADTHGIHGDMPKGGGDLTLSGTDGGNYSDVALDGYSDWFINVAFLNGGKGMHLSYGHGSPFIYATYDSGGAAITAGGAPNVWSNGGSVLGITINKSHYGLFGPSGSTWTVDGDKLTNNGGGKNYFSLAVLPDANAETLALFKRYAYNHVTDTKVTWKFNPQLGTMDDTFTFTTKQYEFGGDASGTITALYPHQWKYTNEKLAKLNGMTYPSVRGVMKVATGPSFTISTPIQGILPMLPPQGIEDKERMAGYLKDFKTGGNPGDTYGEGKMLGRLSSLNEIAEELGDQATEQTITGELKRRLEDWFTATEGKGKGVFTYNKNWGILVGLPGSYGSDWPFNDHHFHYGYFIRACAEIARVDPAWAAKDKWGGMVELLIHEIADPNRDDKMFPFLRLFDRYEGHGWASGNAEFAAGNNEESSSESMNAWYGIAMYGAATGDDAMRDLGLYMYTSEMTAIEEYWWDVSNTNFPKEYTHNAVGMVWGTGGGWGTWFSGDADCIYGIQYLPYTPGSVYLIRYPEHIKQIWPSILQLRKAGNDLNGGWGDLMVMLHAGQDPADSVKFVDSTPNMKVEGGNSRAFMYQWCYTLNNLGLIDRTVTGSYPIYNVYNKDGKKTYAVYNYDGKPLTVKFTDGKQVMATAKGMTVVSQ